MWSVCTAGAVAVYAWRVQCMHVRVRKFIVNKISNGPGDDFLRAPIQIMTPSNRSHPYIQRQRHNGKDLCSPEVKRGALDRERSSSVQTELTGQVTRVYSPPQGRGRASAPRSPLTRPSRCENRPLLYSALYRK